MTDPAPLPDRLPATRWRADPELAAVFGAIETAGGQARFVGGCVRDALLGRDDSDIDVAATLPPAAVLAALEKAGIRCVPTGFDHGTITAVLAARPVEITSLRKDVSTDGRRATVAYTTDWRADSLRRDFTVNALYADPDGTLHDYQGGLADLAARRLRFVGDPTQRIREDRLRILRFYRFLAQLEIPQPETAAADACRAERAGLRDLSAERVAKETLKLLATRDPVPTVRRILTDGIWADWLPEARGMETLARLVAASIEPDPILRLAALLPEDGGAAETVARRLRVSNRDRDRLVALVRPIDPPEGPADARRLMYRLGQTAAEDRAQLGLARQDPRWRTVLTQAACWTPPLFPVKGADIVAAGVAPGPAVGATLDRLERDWIASDFRATRKELLARVKPG